MNLNKAMIIGNLTRDPEMRNTPSGAQVASFSVATSLVWTDQSGQKQQKSEFHNIVAWRKLAEICGQYLRKGAKVYVEGRIQKREYTDKEGVKRYSVDVITEKIIPLEKTEHQQSENVGQPEIAPENKPEPDDLPFN